VSDCIHATPEMQKNRTADANWRVIAPEFGG
jgi:hypothetical protein